MVVTAKPRRRRLERSDSINLDIEGLAIGETARKRRRPYHLRRRAKRNVQARNSVSASEKEVPIASSSLLYQDNESDHYGTASSVASDTTSPESLYCLNPEAEVADSSPGVESTNAELGEQDEESLAKVTKADLIAICERYDIDTGGKTKGKLISELLKMIQPKEKRRQNRRQSSDEWNRLRAQQVAAPSPPLTPPSINARPTVARKGRRRRRTTVTKQKENAHHAPFPSPPKPPALFSEPVHEAVPELKGYLEFNIPYDQLVKGQKIGSGGFKDVYTGTYNGEPVAIGEVRVNQLSDFDIKELEVLHQLSHPNIVKFIGVSINADPATRGIQPIAIITELCIHGDLFDYIRATEAPDPKVCVRLMLDIAKGVHYLHTRKPIIIHRDLKSINVLVDGNVRAKINDFGLARIKRSTASVMHSLVGTSNWQAPEFWSPKPVYNEKVDVYSCALIFWEILTWRWPEKKYPFEDMNDFEIYENVGKKKQRPPLTGFKREFPHELIALVEEMWDHNPTSRPNMKEVVARLRTIFHSMEGDLCESNSSTDLKD